MVDYKIFTGKLQDMLNKYLSVKPVLHKTEDLLNDENKIRKIVAIGILNDLILSKNLFKKNSMIAEFLASNFNILLTKTSMSSRTTICGRITRHITFIDDEDELIDLLNIIYKILSKIDNNEDLFQKDVQDVIRGINLK